MPNGTGRIAKLRLRTARGAAALAVMAGCWGAARGQSEFVLDEASRQWVQTAAPASEGEGAPIAEAQRLLAQDDAAGAQRILDPWIAAHEKSQSPYLARAYLLRGDARTARGNEYKALYDYEAVIKQFPESEEFLLAVERELEIGLRYLSGLRKKTWGLRIFRSDDVGVELLIRVQERTPGSALAERAAIELADYYYRMREIRLAGDAYDLYLQNFPNGPNAAKAAARRIYTDIARFKGPKYDATGLLDAKVRIREFAQRWPNEAVKTGINEALSARLDESGAAGMLEAARWYRGQGDWAAERLTLRRLVRMYPRTGAAEEAREILAERGWAEGLEAPGGGEDKGDTSVSGETQATDEADKGAPSEQSR